LQVFLMYVIFVRTPSFNYAILTWIETLAIPAIHNFFSRRIDIHPAITLSVTNSTIELACFIYTDHEFPLQRVVVVPRRQRHLVWQRGHEFTVFRCYTHGHLQQRHICNITLANICLRMLLRYSNTRGCKTLYK